MRQRLLSGFIKLRRLQRCWLQQHVQGPLVLISGVMGFAYIFLLPLALARDSRGQDFGLGDIRSLHTQAVMLLHTSPPPISLGPKACLTLPGLCHVWGSS